MTEKKKNYPENCVTSCLMLISDVSCQILNMILHVCTMNLINCNQQEK